VLVQRDIASIARLSEELSEPQPIVVPHLDADVHDLASLAGVEAYLFARPARAGGGKRGASG